MNIKKEKKKADDLYQKSLSFFENVQLQAAFQAAADSALIYQEIYGITQQEDIFETFLIYWKNLLYICVSAGLFQTKEGLIQVFQLIVKNFKNNWVLLRLYDTAINLYWKHLKVHYKWRTDNTIDPNFNKKQIKSIEKLLVESLEAAVKLGELLIDDPKYSIKVSKMIESHYLSLIGHSEDKKKKEAIVEKIGLVLQILNNIEHPSSEVLNITAYTEIDFALGLYVIGKNNDAYEHYQTGIDLAKKKNLSEPLRRAEELSNDDDFSKFLVDATAGKINLKEEEIGMKKEGEFNEKVPMVVALDISSKLFNEGNYEKAIELLEEVLNQDPSKDFTASVRYDVWYNLSVIYILTNQFDKAFDAIVKFMKKKFQKIIFMSNYRFESLFFFMDSSKYRKEFKLFVQELGKKLNQIEENANEKKFTDIINELNILKEIILDFVGYDPYGKCIYSDEILVNISNKVQDLINHYVDKENESIIKTFEEDLSNAKEMIKRNLISEAKIKLDDILDNYFNFQLSSSYSLTLDAVKHERLNDAYYSDDNFKKIIDALILIEENELEKLPEEKRLEKYLLFGRYNPKKRKIEIHGYEIDSGTRGCYQIEWTTIERIKLGMRPLKFRQLAKEDFRQEMRIREYLETSSNQNIELASVSEIMSIPSKYRASMKDPITKKDFRKVMNTIVNPINETYENLKKRVNEYNLTNNIQRIDNIPELITFLKEGDMLIQAFFLNYWEDFDIKRFDALIIQFYSYYFDFNPYEADHQFIPYILDSLRKLKGKHYRFRSRIINFLGECDLTNVFNRFENLNFDSMKLEYLKKVSDEIREYNFDVPVENLFNFLLDFSKVIPLKGSDQLTEESNEIEYKIKSVKYLGTLYFKIIEKEDNKKIIYYYDFSKSDIKEKGKLYLDFVDLKSGNVILKIRNEIYESLGSDIYLNWISTNLKSWIDQNIGKIVAKVVQTIIYEKTLENLTMGNYRILQAKINAMGKNIENLKNRFFEIKAPLTLNSFECSECGATLNITSKEEKFIICDHCSTPFLMEWQKN